MSYKDLLNNCSKTISRGTDCGRLRRGRLGLHQWPERRGPEPLKRSVGTWGWDVEMCYHLAINYGELLKVTSCSIKILNSCTSS